jgi:hypothetical protein
MADPELPAAKAVLLAVQLTSKADIPSLRTLISGHRKALRNDIILRVLLSYLPESLESSEYVPFLKDLVSGRILEDSKHPVDSSAFNEISNIEASKKVRKLHLLPLAWLDALAGAPADPLVQFLIHRALRIDENTGLITQVPELLAPFLDHSAYLRTWMISTILPLLRLNYHYHPQNGTVLTILAFENLDDRDGVTLLLSRTGKDSGIEAGEDKTVGRDLRGLIGPWIYGDTRRRRQKARNGFSLDAQTIAPLDEAQAENHKCARWEEVFKWIAAQAATSWNIAVEAIEQWDGPGDVDLGGYEDGTMWLDEDNQQHLERRYAQAALASAYLVPDASVEALIGVHRILSRIVTLLDHNKIPTLPAAAALLSPVSGLAESGMLSLENAMYLRNGLLEEQNVLTRPKKASIQLLHALLTSAYLLTRTGHRCTIRKAGELALLQDEREQRAELLKLIYSIGNGPKGDDKYWVRMRNEILWLRSWGAEELWEGADGSQGRGVFGKTKKEFVEAELLKALLANTRE